MDSKQRSHLRSIARNLKPIVQIGKNGLTDESIETIRKALEDHELIKVKFLAFKEEKEELSHELLEKTRADLVDRMGNIVVLYIKHPDQNKRKISVK